jgi:hypothetical protein
MSEQHVYGTDYGSPADHEPGIKERITENAKRHAEQITKGMQDETKDVIMEMIAGCWFSAMQGDYTPITALIAPHAKQILGVMREALIMPMYEEVLCDENIHDLSACRAKMSYDAYVKTGFSPDQAMQLVLQGMLKSNSFMSFGSQASSNFTAMNVNGSTTVTPAAE